MYICICNAVTDRDIRDAVLRDGVRTAEGLADCLLVGTGCGKCREAAADCLQALLADPAVLAQAATTTGTSATGTAPPH